MLGSKMNRRAEGATVFERILLATDFSQSAMVASRAAYNLATCFDSALTLLNVLPPEAPDRTRELALDYLHALREERFTAFDDVTTEVASHSRPHMAICERAEAVGADLVVVGRHGRHSPAQRLIGSEAERVVRHASTSVLVANPPHRDAEVGHLLVGTDFSRDSETAIDAALAVAQKMDVGITLIHVCDLLPPIELLAEPAIAAMQDRCKEKLERLRAQHFGGYPVDVLAVRDKSAVTALCDWAGEHHVDLIVLGTHGLTGLSRLLLGSVSERTVRHAPCSVLVMRRPKNGSAPAND